MATHGSLPVKTDTAGDVAVKFVDASGINQGVIDAHGSQQTTLVDSSGNPVGTSSNPEYHNATLIDAGGTNKASINSDGALKVILDSATGLGSGSGNPIYVNTVNSATTNYTFRNSGQLHAVNIAPAGTATLAASAITNAKTGNLANVVCSSSVGMRYDITVINSSSTATTMLSVFTTASNPVAIYKPFAIGEISTAGDGTNAKFEVVVTNIDGNTTADAYVYIAWTEA